MSTIEIMDCGEISCEYCSKDKCIYMAHNEAESKDKTIKPFDQQTDKEKEE